LVCQIHFAQIKLSLDSAPGPVLEFAAAIELVHMLAFGGDQQKLDLFLKLGKRSMAIIAIAPMLDVPEPVVVTHAEGMNDLFREMTFRCELVEPLDRCLDPVPPGPVLLGFAGVRSRRPAWARLSTRITAGSSKPWPTNVTRMTENVKKRMRSLGKGSPFAAANGIASAAASETMPRTPVEASTNGHCHGGEGSLRLIGGKSHRGR
jgi:hypothetical protein